MAAADQESHVSAVRPRSYKDESYLHGFLGTVSDLQKAAVLQDVVLEVEGRRFPCHRLVLSAASPYFRAMFTSDMAESRQKTVVLQGLDACMFGEILSYMYSGTLHVSLDKVQPLYQAADLLQLDYVRHTCSSYIAMNVEGSTCVDLYKFADVYSVDIVRKACLQAIAGHFIEFSCSEEFCSLSVNQLLEIISHDELGITEETAVWEAVVRWVEHSREDRLHRLPSILPHIRFNLLTSADKNSILEHPLVRAVPGSSKAIRSLAKKTSNLKKRSGMETVEMALLFSERDEMLWIDPEKGKYIRCRNDIHPITGAVTSDNDIYILGLETYDSRKKYALFKYNHAENKWEQKSSLRWYDPDTDDDLFEFLIDVDGQLFYLIVTFSMIELKKYNQHTNTWHNCSTPQHDEWFEWCVAVSCNRRIYLFKHALFTQTEVLSYNPRADQWCRKPKSDHILDFQNAVAMGTKIFCTDSDFEQTIVYDTKTNNWFRLPGWLKSPLSTNKEIEHITLFALQNKLHAVVDHSINSSSDGFIRVQQVFLYDRYEGIWKELSVLPEGPWAVYHPMVPVAHMCLPYLNARSHATHTQVTAIT
ncbi:kelch repeat and BTB domain-containing protein 2-like isoform X2 [Branchiostoma floridae x Branchiostoma japonicum]